MKRYIETDIEPKVVMAKTEPSPNQFIRWSTDHWVEDRIPLLPLSEEADFNAHLDRIMYIAKK